MATTSQRALHYWSTHGPLDVEPQELRLERFLARGEKPNIDVLGNHFEVIPFSVGCRICASMRLNMEEAYGLTLQRVMPLTVHPRPRLLKHAYPTST
ncbi:hypothetical protein QQP08_011679 [Theobroma cacao]|nr:hypothetical protein QQP08_011679 [Theobroma cacao]